MTCTFCEKRAEDVRAVIPGPSRDLNVCDECVSIMVHALREFGVDLFADDAIDCTAAPTPTIDLLGNPIQPSQFDLELAAALRAKHR